MQALPDGGPPFCTTRDNL